MHIVPVCMGQHTCTLCSPAGWLLPKAQPGSVGLSTSASVARHSAVWWLAQVHADNPKGLIKLLLPSLIEAAKQ